MIPNSYTIDESAFEPDDPTQADIPTQIETALTETETVLVEAKQFAGYFQLGYQVLISLMALFVLGISLVSREVKYISRHLGTSLLVYGILEYALIYFGKLYATAQMVQQELSMSLGQQSWLVQFIDNLIAPLVTLSLTLMITGAILIIISFVYRPRRDQFREITNKACPNHRHERRV